MNEKKQSSEILWHAMVVGSINGWLDTDIIMTQMIDLVYKYAKSYYNVLHIFKKAYETFTVFRYRHGRNRKDLSRTSRVENIFEIFQNFTV